MGFNSVSMSLTYLELSVFGKIPFKQGDKLIPYLIAGPYFGRRVGCEVSADLDFSTEDEEAMGSLNVNCKTMLGKQAKWDTGVSVGLGFGTVISIDTFIFFEALFNHSIRGIDIDDDTAKHRYLTFRLGVGRSF